MTAPASNITWIEYPGLAAALAAAGLQVVHYSTGPWSPTPTTTQDFINAYSPVPFAQQQALAALAVQLDKVIASGFTYQTNLYAIDPATCSDIDSMANAAQASIANSTAYPWPSNFFWPTVSGAEIAMTAPEMVTFGYTIAHYVRDVKVYAQSLAAQIMAATSVSGVEAVSLTTGWPTS